MRNKSSIRVRRVYDPPERGDGVRLLVDRLWPRGLTKEAARVDGWASEVAPSPELRRWFAHDAHRWDGFQRRYFVELDRKPESWEAILRHARRRGATLLYAARDTERNNAIALRTYLQRRLTSSRRARGLILEAPRR